MPSQIAAADEPRAASVSAVALALGHAQTVEDIVRVVVELGFGVLECASGGLAVRQAIGRPLRVYITGSYSPDVERQISEAQLDADWPMCRAARTGESFLFGTYEEVVSQFPGVADAARGVGAEAIASLPLIVDGRLLGSINVAWNRPRSFDNDDVELAYTLAAQCAQALDRILVKEAELRATQALTSSSNRVSLLLDAMTALVDSSDIGEAMRRLASLLVPTFADWAVLGVLDVGGESLRLEARNWEGDLRRLGGYTKIEERLGAAMMGTTVIEHGTASLIDTRRANELDLGERGRVAYRFLRGTGARSLILAPLAARGRLLGGLVLGLESASDRVFTDGDLDVAVDLGRRAGLVIENMRLQAASQRVSESLQRILLSPPPQPPGWDIEARYQPAARQAEVGGDWHDAFVQPDGSVMLVIGDVMGHDIRAAATMGQLRTLVRGIAFNSAESPATILDRVDAALAGLGLDTLATCVLAQLSSDPQDPGAGGCLRWSNAGHLPPVLLRGDGRAELLNTEPELLLGLQSPTVRTEHRTTIPRGGGLLFFTDGLVERRGAALEAGLDRLVTEVTRLRGSGVSELCDELLRRLIPPQHEDDVAMLAVRQSQG